jgi:diguanylate cyclase (GGDEF)-like protein
MWLAIGGGYAVLLLIVALLALRLERHRRAAMRDQLTGLPNLAGFLRLVADAVEEARRADQTIAVAVFDLDGFMALNDALGPTNGDRLLQIIASRLKRHMRGGDVVARLRSDHFGVILKDGEQADGRLVTLCGFIEGKIEIDDLPVTVKASVGYAVAPDDGSTAEELLHRADVAMHAAKSPDMDVVRWDAERDRFDPDKLTLIARLRTAIETDELVLHYQPKVSLTDGRVHSVEALVRWDHPTHGRVAPGEFLPLAEQTDLIDHLTQWVLERAMTELRELGPAASDVAVAVNVSARNLKHEAFAHDVLVGLDQARLDPTRLIVELTETALMHDPARVGKLFSELDDAGVKVSIDDFGSGYTSLGYLSSLPVRELKIDGSFVMALPGPRAESIVRSIIDVGHNLELTVVGECVENDATLSLLRDLGCDQAQGFVLARPMPSSELIGWLQSYQELKLTTT